MQQLEELQLVTNCSSCIHKCCHQPYDWVFLTTREIKAIRSRTGLSEAEFVTERKNLNSGLTFQTLNLPCRFLDKESGLCTVYEERPLVCRIFPFYLEPLTGHATLLPVQCGVNLQIVPLGSLNGWSLRDFETAAKQWLAEIWDEAELHQH